jgi:hypothetical protein
MEEKVKRGRHDAGACLLTLPRPNVVDLIAAEWPRVLCSSGPSYILYTRMLAKMYEIY